ncbi:hypothetical protein BUV99_12710 [Corynebacterium diphtheriae]|nr:hypothetical protein BUV99_12710 [Corynebacterium diphtheriae]
MQAQEQRSKILIVGSGFGGLGMAIRLKQQGIHDFKITERAAEVGGTWRASKITLCFDSEQPLYRNFFGTCDSY